VTNPNLLAGKLRLLATAAPFAMILAASPALAQNAPAVAAPAAAAQDDQAGAADIVVTGTLFRRTDTETPSPVTVLKADDLAKRGLNTVQEAVQRLSANNGGALPNNFTAGGAFAAGASAVSLRGLTTSSTLVLFDGLRAAYYPLADDGTRNFVDLNTIPEATIDRIEVLKDGASSTYGADAVAGVVNIITKKQIKGLKVNVEAGIAEGGYGAEQRANITWGHGDLSENGYNVYLSGEYQHNAEVFSSDLGYPYNTADFSKLCGISRGNAGLALPIAVGATVCRTNGVQNGIQYDGTYGGTGTTIIPVVRPYDATNTNPIAGSRYQLLNPAAGCGPLTPITLTALQATNTLGNAGGTSPLVNCQQDLRKMYNVVAPEQTRLGGTAHLTVQVGDNAQAYAAFTYYQNKTFVNGTPAAFRAVTTPAETGVTVSTAALALPVYVCAARVNCTAANGTLNPNNPFAALGEQARIVGRLADIPLSTEQFSTTYRGAMGITGTFASDWNYAVDATAMRSNLRATYKGYIFVQHLLDVVADGTYNFVNPSLNSQAVRNYLAPTLVNRSNTELYQGQASVSHAFFDLPGGPLQVAVGGAVRYEAVNAPSANSDRNGPANRYFTINPFGTIGHRTVWSANFEISAPIFNQLEVDGSGRYDHYSSGQSNFSPKIGAKFTPIKQIAFRGTYSKGFRIPSFAEANALPTTGFVTVTPPAAFVTAHNNDAYVQPYSLGLTTVGTPGLQPEKSTNFTAGVIFEPVPWASFTVDYYNIEKTGAIAGDDYKKAVNAYYLGQPIPAGFTVTQDAADAALPGSTNRIAFIQYGFINANKIKTSGLDFSGEVRIPITSGIKFTSNAEATYVILSEKIYPGGAIERYDGSLGPYQITSASGTPKWRGSWQNTLDFGSATLSATAYYSGGYNETAEDNGGVYNDSTCLSGLGTGTPAVYRDNVTPVVCHVKRFINVDMTGSIDVGDRFTLYANVVNVFGAKAPYDPTTYGGSNYNPAWASSGVIGRSFRVGATVKY
jgi:iron complex outermembrane receptor protein